MTSRTPKTEGSPQPCNPNHHDSPCGATSKSMHGLELPPVVEGWHIRDDEGSICSSSSSSSESLVATYTHETFAYFTPHYRPSLDKSHDDKEHTIRIKIRSASTTVGRNIVTEGKDSTGIMIWPATHLLCQYLAFTVSGEGSPARCHPPLENRVIELGCGCGMVGIMAAVAERRRRRRRRRNGEIDGTMLIVCTDMDDGVMDLCRENISLNLSDGINDDGYEDACKVTAESDARRKSDSTPSKATSNSEDLKVRILARNLLWGDNNRAQQIMDEVCCAELPRPFESTEKQNRHQQQQLQQTRQFDTVLAADIIYPATSGAALALLFQSVTTLLKPGGAFLLSFVARDGPRTTLKLLTAASDAGYRIDRIPTNTFLPGDEDGVLSRLPPLMGASVLVLTKADDKANHVDGVTLARRHNESLGEANCGVFPGLRDAIARLEDESSAEEWDAPFENTDTEAESITDDDY